MGDFNASEELVNEGGLINGDGANEDSINGVIEKPKTNGLDLTSQKSTKKEENTTKQTTPKTSPKKKESTPQKELGIKSCIPSAAKPDNSDSIAEDDTAAMLPSDPQQVPAVSDGAALVGETSPLGSILKGSPFERDEKKGEASDAPETGATAEPTQSSEKQAKGPSTPITNGKPKEGSAQKAGPQSKTKTASRSSAIERKSPPQPTLSSLRKSENKAQTSTLPAPTSPKHAATPSKQVPLNKLSPKAAGSKELKKEPLKDARKTIIERPSRPSTAPKAPAAASKPGPKPGKKPGPTSQPSFTKPRPKSPTRPARLPGSATAPTAASTAKLDAAPAASTKPKDRVPSNPPSLRQKPARTSLPAGSKPAEKIKEKTKSRLSSASSKVPEGSFLDRMMRPTQSSSQKTHEKVEAKSPPNKTSGVRPNRKSDGSENAKSESVERKEEQPMESAPLPPVHAPAGSSEALSTKEANKGIDENAPASAAPIPSQ